MKIIIQSDYNAMSEMAASIIFETMQKTGRVNVALTAGATPKRTYEVMIPKMKQNPALAHVHYYNFDEVPLKDQADGMTLGALKSLIYTPAAISDSQIHPLTMDNYTTYDAEIAKSGGLDLMLIGLGTDGHFCGNMPGTTRFDELTYRVTHFEDLPWFQGIKAKMPEFPPEFVTMGSKSVMQVKHLVLIVNGADKAEAVERVLRGPIDEMWPASILQNHPNFTVILDEEAAQKLT